MGKIVIISLNYAPEDTAIGLYSTQMAENLVQKGWEVTVITGFPYYPSWEISKNYKSKKKFFEEIINEVRVIRYKQFVPSNPQFHSRVLQIIDFTLGSFFNLRKIKNADLILSVIPFTSSAWIGNVLAKRLKAKHWIHIQDFEFDAAFETGVSSKNTTAMFVKKVLNKIESKILNTATITSTISLGMLNQLEKKSTSKNYYFPNWVDGFFIDPKRAIKHKLLNTNKFKVLYSGNIGAKQDWGFYIKIVEYFKNNDTIEFIIVGDGAMKDNLKASTKKILNVFHYNPVPYSELNNLLCSADLHILFQKEEVIDTVMPSKILGMMASEKPSIVTGNSNSEISLVFEKSKGGVFLNSTEFEKVISTILYFSKNAENSVNTGKNARKYIISNFSKFSILKNFSIKLKSLM